MREGSLIKRTASKNMKSEETNQLGSVYVCKNHDERKLANDLVVWRGRLVVDLNQASLNASEESLIGM